MIQNCKHVICKLLYSQKLGYDVYQLQYFRIRDKQYENQNYFQITDRPLCIWTLPI